MNEMDGQVPMGERDNVRWLLGASVPDMNWKAALKRCSDDELIYCIQKETRITGTCALWREARSRGMRSLQVEARTKEMGWDQPDKPDPANPIRQVEVEISPDTLPDPCLPCQYRKGMHNSKYQGVKLPAPTFGKCTRPEGICSRRENWLAERLAPSVGWKEGPAPNSRVYGDGKGAAFIGEAGNGMWFLTMGHPRRTIGRSFSSAQEAMDKAEELMASEAMLPKGSIECPSVEKDYRGFFIGGVPASAEGDRSYFMNVPERSIGIGELTPMDRDEAIDIGTTNDTKGDDDMGKGSTDGAALSRKADVMAMDEVYAAGRREADKAKAELAAARIECEAVGKIKAANFGIKCSELLKYVTLYQMKQEKEHRKQGLTWEDFCGTIGESQRSVDRVLSEIQPILEKISANLAEILSMPLSKIRYLGRSISANLAEITDNAIVIDGVRIEISPENKDEIEAAIDEMKAARETEREKHEKEVDRLKKRIDTVVKNATDDLKTERDALVKENRRLKAFDPEEKDVTWSLEAMVEIDRAANDFSALCHKFFLDERLDDCIEIQAKVEGRITEVELALSDLRRRWTERFCQFGE